MTVFRYPALRVVQTLDSKPLVLFSASAIEIDSWAGVPQKKRFGTEVTSAEAVGFQREENPKRIAELDKFFSNEENVIQNPLLCAARVADAAQLRFIPLETQDATDGSAVTFGHIEISIEKYDEMSFQDILGAVRKYLTDRVPELKDKNPNPLFVASLKEMARSKGHFQEAESSSQEFSEEEANAEIQEMEEVTGVLFEESHIYDFWEEIAARHEVSNLIETPIMESEFLGFTKEALRSYLCPIVLVDGQHRLKGAVESAKARLNAPEIQKEMEKRIADGDAPDDVQSSFLISHSRPLPVSLLLTPDPSEQVFQFVCVNQKATPIGKALLGTIVSTTLSNEELERVAARLRSAGIELAESQAIAYLSRNPDSPFYGLVERGMAGDAKDLLQWGVFASLIEIFRDLRGGKPYHEINNDYADIWRKKYLDMSPIVADFESRGFSSAYEYWSSIDGPWRGVFMDFWTRVRDFFGNVTDPDKFNYWGRPRTSNLFNKISLTILASDFFQYLVEQKKALENNESVDSLVDGWLEGVDKGYFDKDWLLAGSGTKKDNPGIRRRWASIWAEYRKNTERLPDRRNYSKALSA